MTDDLFQNQDIELASYAGVNGATLLLQPQSPFDQNLEKKILKLRAEAEAQKSRTWSYYQQLKKDNPSKYWSPKVQAQMHRDSEALGDKFEDGNFNTDE